MFERIKTILEPLQVDIYDDFVVKKITSLTNYIVFQESRNEVKMYADGKPLIRQSNCQLDVFETKENKKQLSKDVEDLLSQNDINYTKINVGYLSDLQKTQVTFEFNLI